MSLIRILFLASTLFLATSCVTEGGPYDEITDLSYGPKSLRKSSLDRLWNVPFGGLSCLDYIASFQSFTSEAGSEVDRERTKTAVVYQTVAGTRLVILVIKAPNADTALWASRLSGETSSCTYNEAVLDVIVRR